MAQRVYANEAEVGSLLTRMRLPLRVVLELAQQVAGEKANVSPDDAPPVVGFETWRWGIRYCRENAELRALGWILCEEDQVSGIRNDELKLKLVFCNTDSNTGNPNKSPKNTNEKGPAGCKLIGQNSGQLSFLPGEETKPPYDLWYLCAFFSDEFISLEISRPSAEVGGIVTAFSDRLIVAKPHELPGIRRHVVPEEFADVPKPQVTRKG